MKGRRNRYTNVSTMKCMKLLKETTPASTKSMLVFMPFMVKSFLALAA